MDVIRDSAAVGLLSHPGSRNPCVPSHVNGVRVEVRPRNAASPQRASPAREGKEGTAE